MLRCWGSYRVNNGSPLGRRGEQFAIGRLTYLLLAALDLQLQGVLQVLLQTLLGLDLLLQEQDLRFQLLLHVVGRCPQRHQVLS